MNEIKKYVVNTPSCFEVDTNFDDLRYMKVKIAMMHSGKNLNRSYFSKEVIENAKDTFKNIPVLASIVETDNGLDYNSHDMHIEEDKFNEGSNRIIYDENIVGIIPESNNFELILDDKSGNYYVYVDALLYRDYGNYCCDILQNRGGTTDVSAEISCEDVSFSVEEDYYVIGKMYACGVTLLGSNVNPGMKNAHATQFAKSNSFDEMISDVEVVLKNYYSKQIGEEVNIMEDKNNNESNIETRSINNCIISREKKEDSYKITYELSHDDIRIALYNLISVFENEDNDWYYITDIYDDYFIMHSYDTQIYYGCKYSVDENDNVALSGNRYRLYKMFVTDEEKTQIEELRKNFETVSAELEEYKVKEENDLKENLLKSDDYASINDTEEFQSIKDNIDTFSYNELHNKCDEILLSFAKSGRLIDVAETTETKTPKKVLFSSIKSKKKSRYGNLFNMND